MTDLSDDQIAALCDAAYRIAPTMLRLLARAQAAEAAVQRVRELADRYRANCDPTSGQAEVAELFRAAVEGSGS